MAKTAELPRINLTTGKGDAMLPSMGLLIEQCFMDISLQRRVIGLGLVRLYQVYGGETKFSDAESEEIDRVLASYNLPTPCMRPLSAHLHDVLMRDFPPQRSVPREQALGDQLKLGIMLPDENGEDWFAEEIAPAATIDTLHETRTQWESELSSIATRLALLESAHTAVLNAEQQVTQHESALRAMLQMDPTSAPNAAADVVAVAEEYRTALHNATSEVEHARSTEDRATLAMLKMLSADEQETGIERILITLRDRSRVLEGAISLNEKHSSVATA